MALAGSTSSAPAQTGASFDPTPLTCDGPSAARHVTAAKTTARGAWAKKKWRDRTPVSDRQRADLGRHLDCLERRKDRRVIRAFARDRQTAFREYRGYRLVATIRCGPYGWFAIPCGVVACESGYSWRVVNSIGAAGAYQIIRRTWLAYGGGAFAVTADRATKRQQSTVAMRILRWGWKDHAPQGPSAWTCW